jgi:hypothetical protein
MCSIYCKFIEISIVRHPIYDGIDATPILFKRTFNDGIPNETMSQSSEI